ncbi:ArsA family ATPase [Agrococcus casei]|uniref:ArsA family ATPase n=1 Tax=Agrococcus casei TaxID=343512 RepID=UPI003F8E22F2
MLLTSLETRSTVYVGGKGGVGKTTVSSGIAHALAARGRRVLVASTDPAHSLGHLWRVSVGDSPVLLAQPQGGELHGVELDPQATLERHLAAVRATMDRMLPERMHKAAREHLDLAAQAPGSHESAMLERIASVTELTGTEFDTVVFDTAPTGHTLRLLSLPERLTGWTERLLANRDKSERYQAAMSSLVTGRHRDEPESELRQMLHRRRQRFAAMHTDITDGSAGFVAVTVAERLPLAEHAELVAELDVLGIDLAGVVVNRRAPSESGALLKARNALEEAALADQPPAAPGTPLVSLPLMAEDLTGAEQIARIGSMLTG